MPKLNWEIILYNLRDVKQEIEKIEQFAGSDAMTAYDFQTMMEHAYHHLNFAWNTRHISTKRYSKCVEKDFNEWSKFPKDLEVCGLS